MKHTALPGTLLAEICDHVAALAPGECVTVDRFLLREGVPSFWHNDAHFTPADRVLGNIIGAAYTHSYQISHENGNVTFFRHENTGQRRYSDPDRRAPVEQNGTEGETT